MQRQTGSDRVKSTVSNAYQTQSVMTASPARLVAMLFDRAISSLKEAVRAIEAGEIEARWRANNRAIEIVSHLALTLDMDRGGEVAANLDRLYRFMLERLPRIDVHNDPQTARDMIALLEPLRRSWHDLADGAAEVPSTPAGDDGQQPTDSSENGPDSTGRLSLSA
jgi:flagellar secretion chaperone FliS